MPKAKAINQPSEDSIGRHLAALLARQSDRFDAVYMAVAFAKASGLAKIEKSLAGYTKDGGSITAVVGIDHQGTSRQGLERLLQAGVKVYVFHEDGITRTFHPKLYLFERNGLEGVALIGSNNLTNGGLYENFEFGLRLDHDLAVEEDQRLFQNMVKSVGWFIEEGKLLDHELLSKLEKYGCLLNESSASSNARGAKTSKSGELADLFPSKQVPGQSGQSDDQPHVGTTETFIIPLTKTDAKDAGYQSRITIPRTARDYNSSFWGWKNLFGQRENSNHVYWDRYVNVLFTSAEGKTSEQLIHVEDFVDPRGGAFRIHSERLIQGAAVGDILVMTTTPKDSEFDYYAAIIYKSHSLFDDYHKLCTRETPGSERLWGYSLEAPRFPMFAYYHQKTMF